MAWVAGRSLRPLVMRQLYRTSDEDWPVRRRRPYADRIRPRRGEGSKLPRGARTGQAVQGAGHPPRSAARACMARKGIMIPKLQERRMIAATMTCHIERPTPLQPGVYAAEQ